MTYIPKLILVSFFGMYLQSCSENVHRFSIAGSNGNNNCTELQEIILENNVSDVVITRPFGYSLDTTLHTLGEIDHLYGERLFTLANEKFQCTDIDSIVSIINGTLYITYQVAGYDHSGPFTQEYVSNYWESGNGYLLNKKIPSLRRHSYSGGLVDLDSLVEASDQTLLHFGWLNCKGCMEEQKKITGLREEMPWVQFVNVTIDSRQKLDQYLVDQGSNFGISPPFDRISKFMNKPILLDDTNNIFEIFHLAGLFPVNFLVDSSGVVEKIGSLSEVFGSDSVEITRI